MIKGTTTESKRSTAEILKKLARKITPEKREPIVRLRTSHKALSPADAELDSLIRFFIDLNTITQAINFQLNYFAIHNDTSSPRNTLLELQKKLQQITEKIPPDISNALSGKNTFTIMFGASVDGIWNAATNDGLLTAEDVIGRDRLNINEIKQRLIPELKIFFQNIAAKGIDANFYELRQVTFAQLEAINKILGVELFTYPKDIIDLSSTIESCINTQVKALESITDVNRENPISTKQKAMLFVLHAQKDALSKLGLTTPPGLIFEKLKYLIVTTELNFPHETSESKPWSKVVEESLLFIKKNCTEEEFAIHLKGIDQSINATLDKTHIFGKEKFSIAHKYAKTLQKLEKELQTTPKMSP